MTGALKRHPLFAERGNDSFLELEIEVGRIFVAFSERGLSLIHPAANSSEFCAEFARRFSRVPLAADPSEHDHLTEALVTGDFDSLECDLTSVSPFSRRVLDATAAIERGSTRTYQWIARQIGMPRAARAVGNALASNPLPIVIPCHRVLRGDGMIGHYAFGSSIKRELLVSEGALHGAELAV